MDQHQRGAGGHIRLPSGTRELRSGSCAAVGGELKTFDRQRQIARSSQLS